MLIHVKSSPRVLRRLNLALELMIIRKTLIRIKQNFISINGELV